MPLRNFILDELEYVENSLENNTLNAAPYETLKLVSRYYAQEGYTKKTIISKLEEFLLRCDNTVNLVKWQEAIESLSRNAKKYSLVQINYVTITESELFKISQLGNKQLKRLMFTLLCLAKFNNQVNSKNNNWTNTKNSDIFKLANVTTTLERQGLLINSLYTSGYIKYCNVIDNLNINVTIIDDESKPVLYIKDFRNLGYQYAKYEGEPYINCENCGLTIRKTSNRLKYCPHCASEINKNNTLFNYKKRQLCC